MISPSERSRLSAAAAADSRAAASNPFNAYYSTSNPYNTEFERLVQSGAAVAASSIAVPEQVGAARQPRSTGCRQLAGLRGT